MSKLMGLGQQRVQKALATLPENRRAIFEKAFYGIHKDKIALSSARQFQISGYDVTALEGFERCAVESDVAGLGYRKEPIREAISCGRKLPEPEKGSMIVVASGAILPFGHLSRNNIVLGLVSYLNKLEKESGGNLDSFSASLKKYEKEAKDCFGALVDEAMGSVALAVAMARDIKGESPTRFLAAASGHFGSAAELLLASKLEKNQQLAALAKEISGVLDELHRKMN